MADFGQPVANPQGSNLIGTFGDILGLKQRQQALQLQQQQLAGGAAEVAQKQQQNAELQALSSFTKNAMNDKSFFNEDGSLNTQKYQTEAMKVAPTYGQAYIGNATTNANSAVENRKALLGLSNDQRKTIGEYFSAVAANPNATSDDLAKALELARTVSGDAGYQMALTRASLRMPNVDSMPTAQASQTIRQAARNIGLMTNAVGASQSAPTVSTYTTPRGDIGQIQTNPQSTLPMGAIGPATPQGIAPQAATLPSGSIGLVQGRGVSGMGGGSNAGGGGAPAQTGGTPSKLTPIARPGPNAPKADQDNYNAQIQAAGQEYRNVSAAANDPANGVQATRFRNNQILDLIPQATTGPGLKLLNQIASKIPGATGDAYQDLEHYTAQNSAALANIMGVPKTNLGAETAAAAAGSVEKNPGALKEITKTNDALNTAMDLYNRGLAKVTKNGSDMSKAASYKQAFGQNMDVNAIRWADAHRRKDQEEIDDLQRKYGAEGVKEFGRKLTILKSLASKGDLP